MKNEEPLKILIKGKIDMRAFVRKYEVFVKTKLTVKPIDWKTIKDQDFIDDFVRYCFKISITQVVISIVKVHELYRALGNVATDHDN